MSFPPVPVSSCTNEELINEAYILMEGTYCAVALAKELAIRLAASMLEVKALQDNLYE
jgi:hypothetical protein